MGETTWRLLKAAIRQPHLSWKQTKPVVELGRSVADLAESEHIGCAHIAEAIKSRNRQ